MNIVIGIPAYNEEEKIGKLVSELKGRFDNIVICNDGSTDATSKIVHDLGVVVIDHEKNIGYGAAIKSIFLKARDMNADVLITFDADGQHRIEDINKVLDPILRKDADIVIGSRFMNEKSGQIPEYRKIGIKALTKVANVSLKEKLTDSQSGFRAYNRKALAEITPTDSGMGVSTEILIKANKNRFKIIEVPITVLYDGDTSTHNPVSHGTSVLLSTLKYTAIEHPLKFYGVPGVILLSIGLFFVLWTIQYYGEFHVFHLTLAAIATGTMIFGLVALTTAILLFSFINVIRENKN